MSLLKFSIITVSKNSVGTIAHTIESVLTQTYPNIEYIIIDGNSSDGTIDAIRPYLGNISRFLSEPDIGIYDAINKGIGFATGDIVGILNSDDFFHDDQVIEKVAAAFADEETDAVYGDTQFVNSTDLTKVVRYYSSKHFKPGKFRFGYMPAHPTFYVRRRLYDKLGSYKTDYEIAADYELALRFILVNNIRCKYLEMPFIIMRMGGLSNKSVVSNFKLNREIAKACRENGIQTNYFLIYSKYFRKIFEFTKGRYLNRQKSIG